MKLGKDAILIAIFIALFGLVALLSMSDSPEVKAGWIQGVLTFTGVVIGFVVSRQIEDENHVLQMKRECYMALMATYEEIERTISAFQVYKAGAMPSRHVIKSRGLHMADLVYEEETQRTMIEMGVVYRSAFHDLEKQWIEIERLESKWETFASASQTAPAIVQNALQGVSAQQTQLFREKLRASAETHWHRVNLAGARVTISIRRELRNPIKDEAAYLAAMSSESSAIKQVDEA